MADSKHSAKTEKSPTGSKKREGSNDRSFAANHLEDNKQCILELWESEVRSQVTASGKKSSLVLKDSVPVFIDELVAILREDLPVTAMVSLLGMSKKHGRERAEMAGYFLPELLIEFSILRRIINEELFQDEALSFEVPMTVDKVIDSAVSLAATEFVKVQGEALASALDRAKTSNRDLEGFASVAAHDLKSPLATAIGYLDLLHEELESSMAPEDDKSFRVVKTSLMRMTKLIDQMLEFAQTGDTSHKNKPVKMSDALAAAIENLNSEIRKSETKIESSKLPSVLGNEQLLTQVFQNLIANSMKFRGDASPKIHIGVKSKDENWVFSITDNGVGFDPKLKDQIFDLYKRASTDREVPGTGIGLATCRRIIESHNGKIWADSKPGHGSVVHFSLPKLTEGSKDH